MIINETIIIDDNCTQIFVESIVRTKKEDCTFVSGLTCENEHTFKINLITLEPMQSYLWETDLGEIVGSATSEHVTIKIASNRTKVFTMSCTVSNGFVTGTVSAQFDTVHIPTPTCIHAFTDGTWYGYEYEKFGRSEIDFVATGERFYAQKWKVDGEWRLMFGDDGLAKLPDTDIIKVTYLNIQRQAIWDGAGYVMYDANMVDESMVNYDDCLRDYCILLEFTPNLVIQSDFKELK